MCIHVYDKVSEAPPQVQKGLWVVDLAMQCLEKFMVQWLAMT